MKQGKSIVLVTGATGFVGRHLAPALAREGWIVRRAVRHGSATGDNVLIKSIGPTTDWGPALAEAEAVVHLAARVHHPNEEHADELYRMINTEGTLQLARSAARAGVKQFLYVSTILVNGSCTDGRPAFREDDEFAPRGVYGMSKAQAELGLKHLAQQSGMRISVVRPPLVYGPGAGGNFRHLVTAVELGIPLPLGSIRNRRAFVSVQNLASFISSWLSAENEKFAVYLIADQEQISTPEFIRRIASAMDRRAYLMPVPPKLLELAVRLMRRPELRDSLIGSMEIDISAALSTGWKPVISMNEGLRMAIQPVA
jgi:UDP-glucose 4-epimerase